MTAIPSNWAELVIAARKKLGEVAALAEDRRFDEAITACGDLQQLAGEARSAIWYAEREQARTTRAALTFTRPLGTEAKLQGVYFTE